MKSLTVANARLLAKVALPCQYFDLEILQRSKKALTMKAKMLLGCLSLLPEMSALYVTEGAPVMWQVNLHFVAMVEYYM